MSTTQKTADKPGAEELATVARLMKDVKVAMLTSVCQDGSLHSRPMATQEHEFDGSLWFFTRDDSAKAGELAAHPRVNVSYARPDHQHYVSLAGTAELVRDPAKVRELWNPALTAWFPKGQDDPALALLRVDVETVAYWDAPSSAMVHLIGYVAATVTGRPYNPGEHRVLDLTTG